MLKPETAKRQARVEGSTSVVDQLDRLTLEHD